MLKRTLIFIHRWLGIALCVLFLLWFPSGIGMMYWPYPSVSPADRLQRAPALDPASIRVSPAEAAARAQMDDPGQVHLSTDQGRPVYRVGGPGGILVYADTGEERGEITRDKVPGIAAAWTGQPADTARVEEVQEVDQWTLQISLANVSPLWKFSWPNGEQVYVSEATGEVVQYTTTASRLGAYLGPIPHWFYFTPLRKHGPEWSRVVIWTSGIGTVAAILGVVVGVWMYSPSKRYRYDGAPSSIPYRGQKRWHTVLGLVFGVATITYAFSGMLSMDPFPSLTDGRRSTAPEGPPRPSIPQVLRGQMQLTAFAAKHPGEALRQLAGLQVKELELLSFAGDAVYLAAVADGSTRVVPVHGAPRTEFDARRIIELVTQAAPGRVETSVLTQYDRYYLDRTRQRPLPVVLAQFTDGDRARYYIDPKTARVVGSYDDGEWVNRWLYNGLHSLNFPWLYNYRPLWDVVVISLMLGGTALGVTSLILAWRVLGRKIARVLPSRTARGARLSEDLA